MKYYLPTVLLALGILVSGCVSPKLEIQGGGFRNMTDYAIENAELRVKATGGVASCSYITAQGYFSTRIPLRPYSQNPIIVSWTSRGRNYTVGPLVVPIPEPMPDEPVVAVVRMYADGVADIRLVPVSEIPPRYLR